MSDENTPLDENVETTQADAATEAAEAAEPAEVAEADPVEAAEAEAVEAEPTEAAEAAEAEPAEPTESDADPAEGTDAVANAAAALGDTTEVDAEGEYRRRLREFTRELKKQPGNWYIIQTYSSYENKVKTNLDMRAQTLEVEEYIHEVVVPIEQVMELKDGKKKLVKRKLLPGYVLVRMDINDKAWSVVRDTPGVTSFVGNEGNATVVKHRDVAKFLMPKAVASQTGEAAATASEGEMVVAMPEEPETPKYAHDFEVGDAVTILSGALASVSASISEIDPATGKIQALVSIFGRETPVELTPDQIEKIS